VVVQSVALGERTVATALALAFGTKPIRFNGVAQRLVAAFGKGRRPRRAAIAAQLAADRGFVRIARRTTITFDDLPPPRLQPAAGAPARRTLPKLTTVPALARWLGVEPSTLHGFARQFRGDEARPSGPLSHYRCRLIARRGRLPRLIEAPKPRLAGIQRRLLRELFALVPVHPSAHGFVAGRSVKSAAAPHAGKACVLRLDAQDFFASFGAGKVTRVLLTLGYPEPVAAMIARLCTTTTPVAVRTALAVDAAEADRARRQQRFARRHLPQGAPSSPMLANLCAFGLDQRLAGLARRFGAAYTRYADDLLFSGDEAFARQAQRCADRVAAILLEEGLAAAYHKTRIARRGVAQRALGLVLNEKPAVPRRERDRLEAILHNCVRRGPAGENRDQRPDFRAFLQGRVAWVEHMHAAHGVRLRTLLDRIDWSVGGTGLT